MSAIAQSSDAATNTERQRSLLRSRRRSVELGLKITLAFASVALMTVIAGGTGVVSFNRIAAGLQTISDRSVPHLTAALTLAADSARVAATAARMPQSETSEELNAVMTGLAEDFRKLDEGLAVVVRLSGDSAVVETMTETAADLRLNLESLAVAIGEAISLDGRLSALVADAADLQRTLQEQIVPLIDEVEFTLIIGAEEAMSSSADAVGTLLGEQVDQMSRAQRAHAEANLLYGILAQALLQRDDDQLTVLGNAFTGAVGRLQEMLAALPDGEETDAIRAAADAFLAYGLADPNVFDRASRRALSATDLASAYQSLVQELLPFVDEAYFEVVIGGEAAMQENQEIIGGLMDHEVAQLTDLLALQAQVNLIGGLLATSANETDPAQLHVLQQRFESARLEVERLTAGLADAGIDNPELFEPVARMATLGVGEDSVFTVRSRYLASTSDAQAIVAEAATAAAAMGTHVERTTVDAQTAMESANADVRSLIDILTLVLYGVVCASLVLSAAIVLLFIRRSVVRTIVALGSTMRALAGGDRSVAIPAVDRRDELGEMAAAIQVFKDNAVRMEEMRIERQEAERKAAQEKRAVLDHLAEGFESKVGHIVQGVSTAATQMQSTAESLSAISEEASCQSATVANASEQAMANVENVASAANELGSSIGEISQQVQRQADMAEQAATAAETSNRQVQSLAERADGIGEVVNLITGIAEQTNLLALNATIEAARAGNAGKGFAVVASEVKSLANQTAKATEQIATQIKAVQEQTESTVKAICLINEKIAAMKEISATIASAIEEQNAATQEIGRNAQEASAGTRQVSQAIGGVSQAASEAGQGSTDVLNAARELSKQAVMLSKEVNDFIALVRAA